MLLVVPITTAYTSILALLMVALAVRVVQLRYRTRIALETENNDALQRAFRLHANAVEYIPMALLLMLMFELNNGAAWVLHAAGIILCVARLLHIQGIMQSRGVSLGRTLGTAGTWGTIISLSASNSWMLLRHLW